VSKASDAHLSANQVILKNLTSGTEKSLNSVSVSAPERQRVRRAVWQCDVAGDGFGGFGEHFCAVHGFWPQFHVSQVQCATLQLAVRRFGLRTLGVHELVKGAQTLDAESYGFRFSATFVFEQGQLRQSSDEFVVRFFGCRG
jgi:hypothetical protein